MHLNSRLTPAAVPLKLTLIALLAVGASLSDPEAQPKACDPDIRPIQVNQTTLHYFECGKGEAVVFVHGGLGDLHTFERQVQTFATTFRVIAYSRRFSPPNSPPRDKDVNPLSIHVADLQALITRLKAAPAHLVGNSYGAYIALALALDHDELVRSLVLGEPPVLSLLPSTSVGEAMRQSWIARVIEPSRKAFEGGDLEDGMRRFIDGICGKTACFDNLPQSRRAVLVEKQAPELRSQFIDRALRQPASSRLWEFGEVDTADALGDGRAKPRDVLPDHGRTGTLPRG